MTALVTTTEISPSSSTRILAVIVSLLFLVMILELVRRRRLQERYTVIWFAAGVALLVLALAPGVLVWLSGLAGIADPNAMLFAMALLTCGLLILNLTVVVSRQSEQIARLAQEVGLLGVNEPLEREQGTAVGLEQSPPSAEGPR